MDEKSEGDGVWYDFPGGHSVLSTQGQRERLRERGIERERVRGIEREKGEREGEREGGSGEPVSITGEGCGAKRTADECSSRRRYPQYCGRLYILLCTLS